MIGSTGVCHYWVCVRGKHGRAPTPISGLIVDQRMPAPSARRIPAVLTRRPKLGASTGKKKPPAKGEWSGGRRQGSVSRQVRVRDTKRSTARAMLIEDTISPLDAETRSRRRFEAVGAAFQARHGTFGFVSRWPGRARCSIEKLNYPLCESGNRPSRRAAWRDFRHSACSELPHALACQGPIMSRIRRIASGALTTHSRQALTIVRLRFTEWRSSTPRSGHKPIERCSVIRVDPFWGHRGVVGMALLLFRLITGPYTVRSMAAPNKGGAS
jgi:hypothetical protein